VTDTLGGIGSQRPDGARWLARRTRAVFAPYPKALLGDVEAIHDLRVAARRARVALALMARKPEGKRSRRIDRVLRDVARAAGRSRDLDVAAELLDALAPPRGRAARARATLRRSLAGGRSKRRTLSRDALLDLDLAGLRRDLRGAEARGPAAVEAIIKRIEEITREEGEKILARLEESGRRYHAEAMHEIRRKARRLRYAAEVSAALFGFGGEAVKIWRGVQTRLGALHDHDVLSGWLTARAERADAAGDVEVARAARAAAARVLRDARRLHREFLADDPRSTLERGLAAMRPVQAAPEGPADGGSTVQESSGAPAPGVVIDFPRAAG